MKDINQAKGLIGYCGIYCGGCGMYRGRIIAKVAQDLKELIEAHKYPEWVPEFGGIDFKFTEFRKGLAYFTKKNSGCYCQESCIDGGGVPGCEIKQCAKNRGVEICFECDEFPCKLFSSFLTRHPEIVEEEKKFKKLGMEKWVASKEEESKKGYARATGKYYTEATRKK